MSKAGGTHSSAKERSVRNAASTVTTACRTDNGGHSWFVRTATVRMVCNKLVFMVPLYHSKVARSLFCFQEANPRQATLISIRTMAMVSSTLDLGVILLTRRRPLEQEH